MKPSHFRVLARTTTAIHYLWTVLLFGGGVAVLFYPSYAPYQIGFLTLTIAMWFFFGLKCCLTIWVRYFEKRAGIESDAKPFMAQKLSRLLQRDVSPKVAAAFITIFYIASYTTSVLALLPKK